ncbi:hypothetical protein KAFR_0J02790 [Kazachstania africana CBS 2517]|uniref:ER membrane protein complex subunit 4 n=1 Tax=Kazachstania africana (strain ATCC 22294 / BCRC 22015 / CBS 2517 / CECT 1963 / NBRC 1671 / NRRL Y-8276) TaxID=1071382 RepID=H2B143_KAZAF|nr:hypothetical protein KAFR_0J02790 [Kazachstania africana CBS 2517]CCF60343.1 hypothetical protein KAFR_0J02790 [Kazachstania africana CBS 2517]
MALQPHDWAINLVDPTYAKSMKIESSNTLPVPPGFEEMDSNTTRVNKASKVLNSRNIDKLQAQKAWQIATQPLKSIPMNFFMSYMSGSSLQIIPIMTALMLLSGPIKSMFSIREAFRPVLDNRETIGTVRSAMVVYIMAQGILMYIGIRKLNEMGLIPNSRSDWLAWERHANYNENLRSFTF